MNPAPPSSTERSPASTTRERLARRDTPRRRGFWQPAEWEPHEAVWLAWPSHAELWRDNLPAAQASFTALCAAIADPEPLTACARGERLEILVPDAATLPTARAALAGAGVLQARFHVIPFGDIWLRDTAPIFLRDRGGALLAQCFEFNGWAEKYVLPHDDGVAEAVARAAEVPVLRAPLVLEGGSVEVDGAGTCLTTRQCLLHPGRNPRMQQEDLEAWLEEFLGVERVLWLDQGLRNDHTDGHIDTLARFVAPGVVTCMEPSGSADPNHDALRDIMAVLRASHDARGRRLTVMPLPSPGAVVDAEGTLQPASYANFYIGDRAVVVPTYDVAADDAAVRAVAALFPGRRTVGVPARAILSGGGAFHCITQQQPARIPRGDDREAGAARASEGGV